MTSQQQQQRCSACKCMRLAPTEFTRRNKEWKTCNYCSADKKIQSGPSQQYTESFFTKIIPSNLNEKQYEVYLKLKYQFEAVNAQRNQINSWVYAFNNAIQ